MMIYLLLNISKKFLCSLASPPPMLVILFTMNKVKGTATINIAKEIAKFLITKKHKINIINHIIITKTISSSETTNKKRSDLCQDFFSDEIKKNLDKKNIINKIYPKGSKHEKM